MCSIRLSFQINRARTLSQILQISDANSDKADRIVVGFRSVAVITFASHAKGPQFDPGRKQI